MPAVAVTDHGNMFGAFHFFHEALQKGVRPIIGVEAYIAPGDRTDREAKAASESGEGYAYHLTILAATQKGYRNLVRLVSEAYLSGFYHRPAHGQGAPAGARRGPDRPLRLPQGRGGRVAVPGQLRRRRRRPSSSTRRSSARAISTSRSWTTACRSRPRSCPTCSASRRRRGRRPWRPTTATTSAATTRFPTRSCSASGWARRSRTSGGCASTTTSSTSRDPDEMLSRFKLLERRGRHEYRRDRRALRGLLRHGWPPPSAVHGPGRAAARRLLPRPRPRRPRAAPRRGRRADARSGAERAREVPRAPRVRDRRHREDGLPLLLPDRVRLHPARPGERHRRRPRPRQRRRLDRLVGAADHGDRPAASTTSSSSAS